MQSINRNGKVICKGILKAKRLAIYAEKCLKRKQDERVSVSLANKIMEYKRFRI